MNTPSLIAFVFTLSALTPHVAAQIPPKSVLVSTVVSSGNGLMSVDTAGKATGIATTGRLTHNSVALDPADPSAIWGLGGWPTIGTAPIGHYLMKGLTVNKKGAGDGLVGTFGKVNRCHVYDGQVLITFGTVTPGLYSRSLAGGSSKLIAAITDAFDITTLQGKVYVTSFAGPATKSKITEVDMSTTPAKTRVVPISPTSGTAPTNFRAIATMGWPGGAKYLIIGASDGKLWFVDPNASTGNAFTVTFGASRGMAEAIMTHPDKGIGVCVATSTGLYSQTAYNSGGKPFYTSTNRIIDISVIGGSSTLYGQGCPGSKGEPLHDHALEAWPYVGNSNFTISMENGPASTAGTLVIGLTKKSVPLAVIGAPKCFLNAAIDLQVGIMTNAGGSVVLNAGIPNNSSLVGASAFVQWGIFEKAANAAGLITTKGLHHVIR